MADGAFVKASKFTKKQIDLLKSPTHFAIFLLIADSLLTFAIILLAPYTKIDWDAYISQVKGFLDGERNYSEIRGDTGPIVYPAGFLYSYSLIYYITGGAVFPAQVLFAVLYIINLGIIFFIYVKTDLLPWWALSLVCLSKRVHSIFVLRLFNDCLAATLAHASIALILNKHWYLSSIVFSLAVSVKMNVLLYAPSLLLLMFKAMSIKKMIICLSLEALVQILLGFPFLLSFPSDYLSKAFNLGRVFIHFWSVNFKFVPESIFTSKVFAISLLIAHLFLLFCFAQWKWCRHEGGLLKALDLHNNGGFIYNLYQRFFIDYKTDCALKNEHIATVMFVGNFIGIICARSLHYQFYSWYFYTLPFLLWKAALPTPLRILLFIGVEICWNMYPSSSTSSVLLFLFHSIILWGLWIAPSEEPYVHTKRIKNRKE